jgi:hypothetical protein
VTDWRPVKPPAVPEADFAVHASVYGELEAADALSNSEMDGNSCVD